MTSTFDALPDAVFVLDADGRLVEHNDAAEREFGPLASVVGAPFAESLSVRGPTGRPELEPGDDVVPGPREYTFTRWGGESAGASITAVSHGEGGQLLSARPVDDQSGIAIVSTVSHELRSPLTSVKGYTSLMLSRWDRLTDQQKRDMLEQVHHDADRVTRLVTELLDISRLETGRLVLRRQRVDLAEKAEKVLETVRIDVPDLECRIDVEELDPVYADPDKITQVLTNLVENAAKYGSKFGMVVRIAEGDGEVVVSVSDIGDGIPAEDLGHVFNKFFRRDHGRPTGTGLGLWISKGLVEAHGGELTVVSTVGEGTTFTFTLPTDAFEALHPEA